MRYNSKLGALVAAAGLALGAGQGQAAVAHFSPLGGEVFLSVYDYTQKETYTLDLGLWVHDAVINDTIAPQSFDLSNDPNWQEFKNNGFDRDNSSWVVAGADGRFGASGTDLNHWGLVHSLDPNNPKLDWELVSFNDLADIIGSVGVHAQQISGGDAGAVDDFDANLSNRIEDTETTLGKHEGQGPSSKGAWANWKTDPNVAFGDTGELYLWEIDQSAFDLALGKALPVLVTLTEDSLEIAPVAPVPVPAAAWLFGSALAGIAVRARRGRA